MTKRSLAIFAAITAVLVVLAFLTYRGTGPTGAPEPGDRFFPSLSERLDDVREIRVTYQGETFAIRRAEKGWIVPPLSGYAANEETVVKALRAIADLREFEAKTENEKRFDVLQVEDPNGEKAKSKRVTLVDGDGEELASVIVGKENTTNLLLGRDLIYIRRPESEQAWLAVGNPEIGDKPIDWARKRIMDVDAERMRRYVLSTPNGQEVRVSRPDHKDPGAWKIENKPEGREQKTAAVVAGPSSAIDNLNFRDVRLSKDVDFSANPAGRAVFQSFDGVVVTAMLARDPEDEEKVWVRFEARFDEAAAWKDDVPEGSRLLKPDEARRQVEEINARVDGWAYQLASTAERFMLFTMDNLLKEAEKSENGRNDGNTSGSDANGAERQEQQEQQEQE